MEPHMWWEGGFKWMWVFPFTFMVLMMVFIAICAFVFFRRSGWCGTPAPCADGNQVGLRIKILLAKFLIAAMPAGKLQRNSMRT